jgi:hypothetical protein
LVVITYMEPEDETVRIISARWATRTWAVHGSRGLRRIVGRGGPKDSTLQRTACASTRGAETHPKGISLIYKPGARASASVDAHVHGADAKHDSCRPDQHCDDFAQVITTFGEPLTRCTHRSFGHPCPAQRTPTVHPSITDRRRPPPPDRNRRRR